MHQRARNAPHGQRPLQQPEGGWHDPGSANSAHGYRSERVCASSWNPRAPGRVIRSRPASSTAARYRRFENPRCRPAPSISLRWIPCSLDQCSPANVSTIGDSCCWSGSVSPDEFGTQLPGAPGSCWIPPSRNCTSRVMLPSPAVVRARRRLLASMAGAAPAAVIHRSP